LAERVGVRRARVGVARKLGVVLHRLWLDGTVFRPGEGNTPMRA